MYFNCYFSQMFVSDIPDFYFAIKVKPDIFVIEQAEVVFLRRVFLNLQRLFFLNCEYRAFLQRVFPNLPRLYLP